jgi:hypothetical protein
MTDNGDQKNGWICANTDNLISPITKLHRLLSTISSHQPMYRRAYILVCKARQGKIDCLDMFTTCLFYYRFIYCYDHLLLVLMGIETNIYI